MEQKKLTIDDLLASLQDSSYKEERKITGKLSNTIDTWGMIGERDFEGIAEEAGIAVEEVNDFLENWIEDNPYEAI